jgi:hypothetical protein
MGRPGSRVDAIHMRLEVAQKIAAPKIKDYFEQHPDAWKALRGREVYMFDHEGKLWTVVVGIFPKESMQGATLKDGWIDRSEDRAREWLRAHVSENGTVTIQEVVDWQTL